MKHVILATALLFLTHGADVRAAEPCPPGGEWSAQCFEGTGDARRVKQRHLRHLSFNRHGRATILVAEPRELLAVDRAGRVVIPDIRHTGDFDYPDAEGGVGRFAVRDGAGGPGKCGYFQSGRFTVLVPARYDRCQPFHGGTALACTDCASYCKDPDCHDSVLVGGEGVVLSADGTIRQRRRLPSLDQACGTGKASLQPHGAVTVLRCAGAAGPFDLAPAKR